ncbi:uncharacterized protein [Neodiprion pinetum]|uniref:uncharacterized protein n=1 Tax=Neodiprion pinetum TaxID=441929 RepID=UPI003721A865
MQEIRKEKEVLHRIAQASNAIRRKHRILNTGKESLQKTLKDVFKPVITPLQELVNVSRGTKLVKEEVNKELKTETKDEPNNEMKAEDSFATAEEEDQTVTQSSVRSDDEYLEMLNDKQRQHELDTVYGVRSLSTAGPMGGNSPISFKRDSVRIGGTLYSKTQGLLELLFKKMPNSAHVTCNDKENYRNILLATNAHRKQRRMTIVTDVEAYGQRCSATSAWVTRQGVKTDYIFWDDANEQVERLRLLMTSQAAGNTSHNNEIIMLQKQIDNLDQMIKALEITAEKALDTFYTDFKTGRDLSIRNADIISKLNTRLRALEYEREKASTGDGTA